MPRLRKPEAALARLVFFKQVVETSEKDTGGKGPYVSAATVERTKQFIPGLESGLGNISQFTSLTQKEIREKNQAMTVLKVYIRDFWEVLKRRVYREQLPLDLFALFQLPKSGKVPALSSNRECLEMAELIIKGEAVALESGYAPMTNPDVSQLSEKLDIARKELKDVSEADLQLDKVQESVSGLMPEAKKLVDRIIAELEFNLYEKEDAGKRRIMRNYGVQYEVTKNEVQEEDIETSAN
ncbi:MAG: hypothetical protein JEZ14_15960 [Marinilabiliaceae bacterium]|nr:hypothetical protein [Marinilabiliaceae bacterium]